MQILAVNIIIFAAITALALFLWVFIKAVSLLYYWIRRIIYLQKRSW